MRKIPELLFSNWNLAALLLVSLVLNIAFPRTPLPSWLAIGLYICYVAGISIAAVLPRVYEDRWQQVLRFAFIYFFFFVAAAELIPTFVAPKISSVALQIAPYLNIAGQREWPGFYYSHLLAFNLVAGLSGGLLVNFKHKHAIAAWVWVIPAGVLTVKMWTVEGYSIFESRAEFVSRHFFADCSHPSSNSWLALLDIPQECFDQFMYTAPFYAALGFSIGAWLARKQHWFRRTSETEASRT
jgi:hypothetical protein